MSQGVLLWSKAFHGNVLGFKKKKKEKYKRFIACWLRRDVAVNVWSGHHGKLTRPQPLLILHRECIY